MYVIEKSFFAKLCLFFFCDYFFKLDANADDVNTLSLTPSVYFNDTHVTAFSIQARNA